MILKIIANYIKRGLLEGMTKEQFGFLFNGQILDADGTAQEVLHFIKIGKFLALVLILDLMKAYDRVD